MSSPPRHVGEPSSRESGNDSSRSRRRRRRRPPTPPPPPHEEPSTSTYSATNGDAVWPEPFLEDLAIQVALDASRSLDRLAAAPALAALFQVCATWQTVSHSELLWQNLVSRVWNRTNLIQPTWRDEFIYHHRTARNFRQGHGSYSILRPSEHLAAILPGNEIVAEQLPLFCLRLALTDDHLAAGFSDGSIYLFQLPSQLHFRTIQSLPRDHLGLFSRGISGIILLPRVDRVVYASIDGDVHVVTPLAGGEIARRVFMGDIVNDGTLVDFSGSGRYWVGLYAGVPGRAIRVWDAVSEELLFLGCNFTDPESVLGWHMLTEVRPAEPIARVRVVAHGLAVCFTETRVLVIDLAAHALVVREEYLNRAIVVGSVDAVGERLVLINTRGAGSVRDTLSLAEVARMERGPLRGSQTRLRGLLGCLNSLHVVVCVEGVVRVWGAEQGRYLYSLSQRVGEVTAIAATDRHIAASTDDTNIHLWDFGV